MSRFPDGMNNQSLKLANRAAVLRLILDHGPLSRQDIAARSGLTASTISNITGDLIREGFLSELGPDPDKVRQARGGPRPILVGFNRGGPCVVAVYAGVTRASVQVAGLDGRPAGPAIQVVTEHDLEGALRRVAAAARQLLAGRAGPVLGVGVAILGQVDPQTGISLGVAERQWAGVPVRGILEAELGLPVVVENNIYALTLGESWFGHGVGADSFVLLYCGHAVGCGVVVDRELYRGWRGAAGRLEHLAVRPGGAACACGQQGCLGVTATTAAVLQEAQQAADRPGSLLPRYLQQHSDVYSVAGVTAAAAAGDTHAREVLLARARALGTAVARLIDLFDPQVVALAGEAFGDRVPDWQMAVLQETARQQVAHGSEPLPEIVRTRHGPDANTMGAAALALQTIYYPRGRAAPPSNTLSQRLSRPEE